MVFENGSYEYLYKTQSLSSKHRAITIRHLIFGQQKFYGQLYVNITAVLGDNNLNTINIEVKIVHFPC